MSKTRKRSLALLVVLAMLATLFMMPGTASAATEMWCPKVENVTDNSTTAIGSLFINVDPGVLSGVETLEIELPSKVDLIESNDPDSNYEQGEDYIIGTSNDTTKGLAIVVPSQVGSDANAIAPGDVTANVFTNRIVLTVEDSVYYAERDTFLRIYFNSVRIESGVSGEIKATVTSPTHFPEGSVTLAVCGAGTAVISILDVNNISESGDAIAQIKIDERVAGALKAKQETVTLTLPSGFEWDSVDIDGAWGFDDYAVVNAVYDEDDDVQVIGYTLSSDEDTLKLHLGKASESKGRITINATLKINETKAKTGDVVVEVGGSSNVSPDELVVAKYVEYGATVKEGTVNTVFAGRDDANIGEFYIEENAAGSIYAGRSITLTLPSYARWKTDLSKVDIDVEDGDIDIGDLSLVDDERHILKIRIDDDSTSASKIKFTDDTEIEIAPNASGDIVIEVGGTAGVSGSVKVATIKAPVTIEASSTPDLKIGLANQAAGDLIITEAQKGALMEDGTLTLEAPPGVVFAAVPKVEVIEGDVDLGTATLAPKDDESNRLLNIPIKSESTKASKIKVSGIKFTVYRNVPEGPVTVKVKGSAVQKTASGEWANFTTVASTNNAKVVTPAPGEQKVSASFVIGSTTYKVNGVEQTMDVAPYIKDGRTFMPLRYVGLSLGVAEQNILWDDVAKTATLMKGDKVVQVKIGSTALIVNGVTINMDVAPEIKDGRTMMPLRFIAQAFGAELTWDDATKTASFEL